MDLTRLTPGDFKRILKLLEEKESLVARITDIERELSVYGDANVPAAPASTAPKAARARSSAPRRKRGAMKENVLAALKAAGKDGLTVKELATQLAVPPPNVHTWFATTGKTFPQIQKLENGKRVWVE